MTQNFLHKDREAIRTPVVHVWKRRQHYWTSLIDAILSLDRLEYTAPTGFRFLDEPMFCFSTLNANTNPNPNCRPGHRPWPLTPWQSLPGRRFWPLTPWQSLPGHRPWLLTAINRVSGHARVGAQAGFTTVLVARVGAQAGFATVLAARVGAQADS